MLSAAEATTRTDARIASLVERWSGRRFDLVSQPRYTREISDASALRALMEDEGRTGELRDVRFNEAAGFFYVCRNRDGSPFAQGVGEAAALAICDAFLRCCEARQPLVPPAPAPPKRSPARE